MTSPIMRLVALTGLDLDHIADELDRPAGPGRPWALPLASRIVLATAALRTNLTVRQLAAVFDIPKSQAHRIIADLTPRLAALLNAPWTAWPHSQYAAQGWVAIVNPAQPRSPR